ncbi:hypothetical protein RJ641_026799 [Dillenia turbinata]|uniref:Uncharacterized protein n=1 Tax=Dillenia turbinata TaxID=194707 RepID=A0AAN8W4I0_9MAGN
MVRSFEKIQAQQSFVWRSVFAALIFCFAAFLLYSIYQQAFSPWELRYRAYFMEEINSQIIICAGLYFWSLCISCPHYLIAVLACSITIMGLLKHGKQWIWYSCGVGTALAVFWLNYMLRLPKFRWDIIWLPFGPLSGAVLSLYVEHLLAESSEEVRKLRGYMYAYKAS